MDNETRSRLFEPFFTTKGSGRGNGLGLATVHSIVQQANGDIDVQTSPGKGTQVTIHLPGLRVEPPLEQVLTASAGEPNETVNETVLLVEDDVAVRESMCRVLSKEGYQVVQARNASEALVACRNHPGAIELLISDIVLPGMGGHQVAQRVRQLRPKIRVLFTSGYNREAIAKADRGKVLYFRKPFTGDALLKRVREVLSQSAPQS
jgi:CheY-like chemotaxis protein